LVIVKCICGKEIAEEEAYTNNKKIQTNGDFRIFLCEECYQKAEEIAGIKREDFAKKMSIGDYLLLSAGKTSGVIITVDDHTWDFSEKELTTVVKTSEILKEKKECEK